MLAVAEGGLAERMEARAPFPSTSPFLDERPDLFSIDEAQEPRLIAARHRSGVVSVTEATRQSPTAPRWPRFPRDFGEVRGTATPDEATRVRR
ncbi:MAG: hypothetical protein ACLVC4_07340 [Gordonibacter urolithinfaciens]